MNIARYFIRKVEDQFAIISAAKEAGEVILDKGAKPHVKGKFQMYIQNSEALESRVQEVCAAS